MTHRTLSLLVAGVAAFALLDSAPIAAVAATTPVACATPPATAGAPTALDPAAQACRAALIAQIRQTLNANIADALGVQFQLTQSLTDNSQEQETVGGQVAAAQREIVALDDQIATLDAQIASTQESIDRDRAEAAVLARSLYFTPDSYLLSVFAAGSLQELVTSASDRIVAGARAQVLVTRLSDELNRLNEEQATVKAARLEKARAMERLTARLARLVELEAYQQELSRQVAGQLGQVRAELGLVETQDPVLSRQILTQLEAQQGAILAAAGQQIWTQLRIWELAGGTATPPASGHHSKSHPFVWPEPGATISQGFGPTSLLIEPPYGQFPHFHTGLDLAAPELTPVLAADDGTVALVGSGDYGYGNYVVIFHRSGLASLYGHLHRALVKVGDTVTQGQPIGLEGSTGHSTGPHLHFEVRLNNEPVDPGAYLPPGSPSSVGLNGG